MIATAKTITTVFAELTRVRRFRSLAVEVLLDLGPPPSTAEATDLPTRPERLPGAHLGEAPSSLGVAGGV